MKLCNRQLARLGCRASYRGVRWRCIAQQGTIFDEKMEDFNKHCLMKYWRGSEGQYSLLSCLQRLGCWMSGQACLVSAITSGVHTVGVPNPDTVVTKSYMGLVIIWMSCLRAACCDSTVFVLMCESMLSSTFRPFACDVRASSQRLLYAWALMLLSILWCCRNWVLDTTHPVTRGQRLV
jgi:hypothetical protein